MHFKSGRNNRHSSIYRKLALLMCGVGLSCISGQAFAATLASASIYSFNETTLNQVLDPAKIKVKTLKQNNKEDYYSFTYNGIAIAVIPRDCKLDALKKQKCTAALFLATYNIANNKALIGKGAQVALKVAEFNRKNAYISSYMKSTNVIEAVRFIQISNGSFIGTMRTDVAAFSQSFRTLIKDYALKAK